MLYKLLLKVVMEAMRFRVQVRSDGTLDWPESPPNLPAGEAEVILLVPSAPQQENSPSEASSKEPSTDARATNWPRLRGGTWTGDALRRDELYGEEGR